MLLSTAPSLVPIIVATQPHTGMTIGPALFELVGILAAFGLYLFLEWRARRTQRLDPSIVAAWLDVHDQATSVADELKARSEMSREAP